MTSEENGNVRNEKEERPRNDRQERKLARALLYALSGDHSGVLDAINTFDIPERSIDRGTLATAFEIGVMNDKIGAWVIRSIKRPSVEKIEKRLWEDYYYNEGDMGGEGLNILSNMLSANSNNFDEQLEQFYSKYPSPFEFIGRERSIRELSKSPEEQEIMKKNEEGFMRCVYGKQYDYYLAYQNLKSDTLKVEERYEGDKYSPRIVLLDERERKSDLDPATMIEFSNTRVSFSPMFQIGKRPCVIAYVKQKGSKEEKACAYYKSTSQDMWRLMPDYVAGSLWGISWYGKGWTEESLDAPVEIQDTLERLSNVGPQLDKTNFTEARDAFIGTAARRMHRGRGPEEGEDTSGYWKEVSEKPFYSVGDIKPNSAWWPDYSKAICRTLTDSSLYGEVITERFFSTNKKLLYTIKSDTEGRSWLGGVEYLRSSITSTGVHNQYVKLGLSGRPAFEYPEQAPEEIKNDFSLERRDGYVDESSFVNSIPIIQDYLESRNERKKAMA